MTLKIPSSLQLILRNNKISFVTRKMFPSVPYVPYRLESIDLSYNLLPILTFDISFGTKKLKHLNVSHNAIQEVRKSEFFCGFAMKFSEILNFKNRFPQFYRRFGQLN